MCHPPESKFHHPCWSFTRHPGPFPTKHDGRTAGHSVRAENQEKDFSRRGVSNLCIFCDWLFTEDTRSLAPV